MPNFLFLIVLQSFICANVFALEVTFISPAAKGNIFWSQVEQNMALAAKQLGINYHVEYMYPKTKKKSHLERMEAFIDKNPKTDYFVITLNIGSTEKTLKLFNRKKTKFFSIIHPIENKFLTKKAVPRVDYPFWIGHLSPDEIKSGALLSKKLMDKAEQFNIPNKGVVAILGSKVNPASLYRPMGLSQEIEKQNKYSLLQLFYSDWSKNRAMKIVEVAYKRFKNIGVVWCLNDGTLLDGAAEQLNKLKLIANKDYVIGGMDWSKPGLQLYQKGIVAVSLGGHIFEGGIALALIKDHYHGLDFYQQFTTGKVLNTLIPLNKHHKVVERIVLNGEWSILNYRIYSRFYNKNSDKWRLDYLRILENIPAE